MGQFGYIVIVNGTKDFLNRSRVHSYQMIGWGVQFPWQIDPFSVVEVYVEFDEIFYIQEKDDAGDVTYSTPDDHLRFQIHASFRKITVTTSVNNGTGTIFNYIDDLGWNNKGKMGFVVAGKKPNYFIHNSVSTESWMETFLTSFQDRCLREICLPGSHDAGMSEINSGTEFSNEFNTKTQGLNIHGQLMRGCRYFDIRPIIGGEKYWTGHYSRIGVTYQGSRGQTMDDVIRDINAFTATHNELVILNLSHDLNTDQLNFFYRPFTKEEYQGLLDLLWLNLKHLFYTSEDVTLLPLNKIINGHPAVIVFVDASDDFLGKGSSTDYTTRGFYPLKERILTKVPNALKLTCASAKGQIPSDPPAVSVYDHYSETNEVEVMLNNQLDRLKDFSYENSDCLFLLSWTLTQSNFEAALGYFHAKSIEELAKKANERVYDKILPEIPWKKRPNILLLDYYSQNSFAALVLAINIYNQYID